jgi:hypothetical protein
MTVTNFCVRSLAQRGCREENQRIEELGREAPDRLQAGNPAALAQRRGHRLSHGPRISLDSPRVNSGLACLVLY